MEDIENHVRVLILDYETCNTTIYNKYFFWEVNKTSIFPLDDSYSNVDLNIGFFMDNITSSGVWKSETDEPNLSELSFCMRTDLVVTDQIFYRRDLQYLFTPEEVNDSVSYTKTLYNITVDMRAGFTADGIKKISQKELDDSVTSIAEYNDPLSIGGDYIESCRCDEITLECLDAPPPMRPGDWLNHCIFLADKKGISVRKLRRYTLVQGTIRFTYVNDGAMNSLMKIKPLKRDEVNGVMISLRLISLFYNGFSKYVDISGNSIMQFGISPPEVFDSWDSNQWYQGTGGSLSSGGRSLEIEPQHSRQLQDENENGFGIQIELLDGDSEEMDKSTAPSGKAMYVA